MTVNTQGLHVENVHGSIKKHILLDSINFNLPQGEVLGVIGPNGSGKTTLLKIISGQLNNDTEISASGGVNWLGQSLSTMSLSTKAKILSVVNQLNDGVFSLNVEQIAEMGALPHQSLFHSATAQDKQLVDNALAQVGLLEKKHTIFNQLSGGEQQRGLIARSLVQRAELMVLDEPINHLDVFYQHQILAFLKGLAKDQNITIVMSLHDLNLAKDYCDKICLLQEGAQISFGLPNEVMTPETLSSVFHLPCHHVYSTYFTTPRVLFSE